MVSMSGSGKNSRNRRLGSCQSVQEHHCQLSKWPFVAALEPQVCVPRQAALSDWLRADIRIAVNAGSMKE